MGTFPQHVRLSVTPRQALPHPVPTPGQNSAAPRAAAPAVRLPGKGRGGGGLAGGGHPQGLEAGLHRVLGGFHYCFCPQLQVVVELWSDAGFCFMEDPSPSSSSHTGAGHVRSRQTRTNGSLVAPCLFLQSSHHTFEGQKPPED